MTKLVQYKLAETGVDFPQRPEDRAVFNWPFQTQVFLNEEQ